MDSEKLRKDLENYYGTAMFSGHPMARMDLQRVETATPQELVKIAQQKLGVHNVNDKIESNYSFFENYYETDMFDEQPMERAEVNRVEISTPQHVKKKKQNKKDLNQCSVPDANKSISSSMKKNNKMNNDLLELQILMDELESNYSFFEKTHKDNYEYIKNKYKRLYVLEEIQTELVERLQIESEKKGIGKKERIWKYEVKKEELESIRYELNKEKEQYKSEKVILERERYHYLKEKDEIQAKINKIKMGR